MAVGKVSSAPSAGKGKARVEVSPRVSASKCRGGRSAKEDGVSARRKRNRKNQRVAVAALIIPGLVLVAGFACVGLAMVGNTMRAGRRASSTRGRAADQPRPDGRVSSQAPGGGSAASTVGVGSEYPRPHDEQGGVPVSPHSFQDAPAMTSPSESQLAPVMTFFPASMQRTLQLGGSVNESRAMWMGPFGIRLDTWDANSIGWSPPPPAQDPTSPKRASLLASMEKLRAGYSKWHRLSKLVDYYHGPWAAHLSHRDFQLKLFEWLETHPTIENNSDNGEGLLHVLSSQMTGNPNRHAELHNVVRHVLADAGGQLPHKREETENALTYWKKFSEADPKTHDQRKSPAELLPSGVIEFLAITFDGVFILQYLNTPELRIGLASPHRFRNGRFPITKQTPVYLLSLVHGRYSGLGLPGVALNKRMTVADLIENVESTKRPKGKQKIKASHTIDRNCPFRYVW
eukprot:GHVT01044416.1.p1 GENE.GHVT01044416.1~~GHVT01044416.1.p1  ORF type:complete len:459 (-),score=64.99 GHVT01044416.1:80-1456(-)